MKHHHTAKAVLLVELQDYDSRANKPINLLMVGPPLVSAGWSQDENVRELKALLHDKALAYVPSNRVRLEG